MNRYRSKWDREDVDDHKRCHVIATLAAVGSALGASAGTAAAVGLTAISTVATTAATIGTSVASAVKSGEGPTVPTDAAIAKEAADARRRRAVSLSGQTSQRSTVLTPLGASGGPQVARPTLLGGTPARAAL